MPKVTFRKNIPPFFKREVLWFLQEKFNKSYEEIIVEDFRMLEEKEEAVIDFLKKRKKGYPLQYILGNVHFYGLKFLVKEGVFIPRPETEVMVEIAIEHLRSRRKIKGIDVCCGVGNIGVSLCKYLDIDKLYFIDISKRALKLCEKNCRLYGIDNAYFLQADMLDCLKFQEVFDFITVNPPYVKEDMLPHLQREISFEPPQAFLGGKDGLFYIRKIIKQGFKVLKKGGFIFVEIGFDHKKPLEDYLKSIGFRNFKFFKDFCNKDRVLVLEK